MTTMLIISILLVVSFVGTAIWKLKDIPESISSLVYVFKWKWLWTVWLVLVGILTCAPAITVLDKIGMSFLGFGTLVCLLFCAVMPIWMEDKKTWHDVLGTSACILLQGCVFFICPWWLFMWAVFAFLMGSVYVQPDGFGRFFKGKAIFIAQAVCYLDMMGCLLFN